MKLKKLFQTIDSKNLTKKSKRRIHFGVMSIVLLALTIGVTFAFAAPTSPNQVLSTANAVVNGNATKSNGNINFGGATTTPTTTPPTVTTTMPTQTTMVGMKCTPGIGKLDSMGMGPCINNSQIPTPGFSTGANTIDPNSTEGRKPFGEPEGGAFRTLCDFSHMNYDDPIIYSNPPTPGAAHLHAFFGNANTNAYSTSASLKSSGNSTCAGGIFNRSAYWAPAMVNSATGRPIRPNEHRNFSGDLEIYYKLGYQGVNKDKLMPFPNGLHMIAGNLATAKTETANTHTTYWCEGNSKDVTTQHISSIPVCVTGQTLTMSIDFPQCWDGVNLTSANGRSHLAYGNAYPPAGQPVGCPASHPVNLASVHMFVRYYVDHGDTSKWRLSSDSYTNGPGGYSGHADYMFAWDESAFPAVKKNCYVPLLDCKYNLGDGRKPRDIRDFRGWKPTIYPTD